MADKEKERGKLFSIQMDGSDSVPFIIKKDRLLIGRGDSCEIRIYVDGVAQEHCIITFNEAGRGFIEPLDKIALTYLNGERIQRQLSLEHNDVITVVKRSFRFFYPSSSKFYIACCEDAASFEDNVVKVLADSEVEGALSGKELMKDIHEKHVTFGPRLSPEEFDKSLPPASPLRRGSLPRDKVKTPTASLERELIKKNLFVNSPANNDINNFEGMTTSQLLKSSVVLKRLSCNNSMQETLHKDNSKISRPLFSEILKKPVVNQAQSTAQEAAPKNSSQKNIKKAKLKDSKRRFLESSKPVHQRLQAVGSTGHANSPETIVICKKRFSQSIHGNLVSSVKRRKSSRLVQEKVVAETNSQRQVSESSNDVKERGISTAQSTSKSVNLLRMSSKNVPHIFTHVSEERKSLTMKRKLNGENKDESSAKNINEEISPKKKSIKTSVSGTFTGKSPAVGKSIGTSVRKSVGRSSRKSIGTPERKCVRTPSKKNMSTPIKGVITNSLISIQDKTRIELPSKKINETESQLPAEGLNQIESPANSSSLVAAINNVSQVEGNNLDKSLKDVHNIVQALSSHSNVSALGSDNLSTDMCVNAVKKLAFTISMINSFHMYNRILDDVSSFPLGFPSITSSEHNTDNIQQLPSTSHQSEDIARMSWFQDIVHNFFSNPANREGSCTIRTYQKRVIPRKPSTSNEKSRPPKMSKNQMSLKTTHSGCKISTRKPHNSQICLVGEVEHENNQSKSSDNSSSFNDECIPVASSSSSKVPFVSSRVQSVTTPISNKNVNSTTTISSNSVAIDKDVSFHSSSLEAMPVIGIDFRTDLNTQKSNEERMSLSHRRLSNSKPIDSTSNLLTASVKHNSPILRTDKTLYLSQKQTIRKFGSVVPVCSKILRSRKSSLLRQKQLKSTNASKNLRISTFKMVRKQKIEQKHRCDVLKKIKYRERSPKSKILMKSGKSKSVLFKSRSRKPSKPSTLDSKKRKSNLDLSSPDMVNITTKQSRSVNLKHEFNPECNLPVNIKNKHFEDDSVKIAVRRKRKIKPDDHLDSKEPKNISENEQEKRSKLTDKSERGKVSKKGIPRGKEGSKKNSLKTRSITIQAMTNENERFAEEVTDHVDGADALDGETESYTDRKKSKRLLRSRKCAKEQVSEINPNNETKKIKRNKEEGSPPKENIRITRSNSSKLENKKSSPLPADQKKKLPRKRGKKNITSVETLAKDKKEGTVKGITAIKKNEEKISKAATPKKGIRKGREISKREKIEKEVSPVQRIQRSLRPRK